MRLLASALALGLLLAPAASAANQPKAGTYEVAVVTPTSGLIYCLINLTPKDNGLEGVARA